MKVVFFEDVEGTAQVGEVKEVKNGFARNFLLPRGVAGSTSKDNLQRANSLAQKEARRQEKLDGEARGVAGKLDGYTVTIEARVGETGHLFGSVTNRDIAEQLTARAGVEVDSKIVLLAEPIREIGQKQVTIKFTRNVTSEVTVDVVPDEASKPVVEKFLAEKKAQAEADAKIAAEKKALAEAKAAEEAAAAEETEEE
ncbi:MAG: 50S ribosomal protein L9 [Dehalococcoidia bacterium]|jgi:large subunit ribosomal protein L9|uniref:50S ribosomal protein L9 n=1 Tax=Candidatus Amarobacter glycogenicus TaxID=3140699 RepID=UPI002A11D4EA|nr:50S ribosomal protein L9 [Dehalococcoidia bacterium]MBK8560062.1 50S ribosomal protein L9 [Dehalococcoidia bacterium]MBK9611387.1 50S ribosomal protein L9 [Dehalococcoidia bacterium]MCC6266965.1 50S ribosomal protein L9 [Dehalococcoidia bacterium]